MTDHPGDSASPAVPLVETALNILFGAGGLQLLDSSPWARSHMPPGNSTMIAWGASLSTVNALRQSGHRNVRRFVAFPSRENPRWLLPYDNRRQATRAIQSYTPHSRRMRKNIALGLAALGWPCLKRHTVTIASPRPSYMESVLSEVTHQTNLGVAISLGAPGRFRKMSAQWMLPNGEILCHLKLPLTAEANVRVRHEAWILARLQQDGHLRSRTPRPLHSGAFKGIHFLLQSDMKGEPGPLEFEASHAGLLRCLHQYETVMRPGYDLIRGTANRFHQNLRFMGACWETLGADVLRWVNQTIGDVPIACGLGHGDFAPWNTRLLDRRLSSFDWEAAALDVPCLWDEFHFVAQTHSLLHAGNGMGDAASMSNDVRALYLLYLLDSAVNLVAERSGSTGVAYREREIVRQFNALSQGIKTRETAPQAADGRLSYEDLAQHLTDRASNLNA